MYCPPPVWWQWTARYSVRPAGSEGRAGLVGDRQLLVFARVAFHPGGEDAIEIDLNVLIMVDEEEELGMRRPGQGELAADPDVGRAPIRADDGAGGALRAEAAGGLLPGRVVEIGTGPVRGRLLDRGSPVLARLPGGGHNSRTSVYDVNFPWLTAVTRSASTLTTSRS